MSAAAVAEAITSAVDAPVDEPPPPLRRLPLPVTEPRPGLRLVPRVPPAEWTDDAQQALTLAGTEPAPRSRYASASASGSGPGASHELHPEHLPDPRTWAARFVQAAVEVGAGVRPPGQLTRWTTGDVLATLTRRHQIAARMRARPDRPQHRTRVGTVRTCSPRSGAVEVSAVVHEQQRVRAVALRLEVHKNRWYVTAFEFA